MADSAAVAALYRSTAQASPLHEPAWLRWSLIALAILAMALLVVLPLAMVIGAGLAKGAGVWFAALIEPDAIAALKLTLFTAAIVIPLNAVFGVLSAWAVTRFEFAGKRTLMALIDLPFAVSPVVAGLCLVLLFSPNHGWFAGLLEHFDVKILFARPAIVLATLFITYPFVVRELIPLMQQQGSDEEIAARSLGANAWTMFFRVTLPNIKWGLLYGVLLCGARAMGEFGAVSVVSGHIRGLTNTLPLHIEILYNDFNATAAFAVASLLAGLALVTLVVKFWLESRHGDALANAHHRRQ
ncbi:MAG: sulfate ABC transporter permease subunit CysW [Luteimonas sp.]